MYCNIFYKLGQVLNYIHMQLESTVYSGNHGYIVFEKELQTETKTKTESAYKVHCMVLATNYSIPKLQIHKIAY